MTESRIRAIPTALILILAVVCLSAHTVVLPFKIGDPESGNHHWLGRAVSFYLATGLALNAIENIPPSSIQTMLHAHRIGFPYSITKATGIKLALQSRARILLWGEINRSGTAQDEMIEIKSYIIDLSGFTQKYLPLLKFKLDAFYAMQKELLRQVLKQFDVTQPKYPQLDLDYHTYELYIKSLLLQDPEGKLPLLNQAHAQRPKSQFLNLELAKWNLNGGDLETCRGYLERVSDAPFFKIEKDFITALTLVAEGKNSEAEKIFRDLAAGKRFAAAANNNLAVIAARRRDLPQAQSLMETCLTGPADPEIFFNTVFIALLRGDLSGAEDFLRRFLLTFPDEEDLIRLFSYVLSRYPHKDLLISAFSNHIPGLTATDRLIDMSLVIKNPFLARMEDISRVPSEYERMSGSQSFQDTSARIQALEKLAEANPFIPDLHGELSSLYFNSKQIDSAFKSALCAAHLKPTEKNFIDLLHTLRAAPGQEVDTNLAREIRRRFPRSKRLGRLLKRLRKRQ